MSTHAMFQHFRTGNRQSRDRAAIQMRNDPLHFTYYDLCEPLDAPEELPAGSVTRTEYTNWRGKPVISQTSCKRG